MANPELISRLAAQRHIGDRFLNYLGQEEVIPIERKERMLRAMGYDLEDNATLEQAIFDLDAAPWTRLVKPVYVVTDDQLDGGIGLHIPDPLLHTAVEWQVTLEDGTPGPEGDFLPADRHETGEYWIGEQRYSRRPLPLSGVLPMGYHRLTVSQGAKSGEASLIMAPKKSFQREAMADGKRIWGSAIQLYTLKSDHNWGMGDFSDLEDLIRELSSRGAGFVGLNPIHSLYPVSPEHASPYSPSNRSFINPLYVDVARVPEFMASKTLQAKVAESSFQEYLQSLRDKPQVDYASVSPLKYGFFADCFEHFKASHLGRDTEREQAFNRFVEEGGPPLFQHATFEALLAHFKAKDINAWGWPVWPDAYQDHGSPEVQAFIEEHPERINYYLYLQFIADEQLQRVNQVAEQSTMTLGLYRDLAVGADCGGAEIWSNRERFCTQASVGAPPDALGPTGQNWGLPPLDPVKLEADGYRAFITLVSNNMRGCGALRIDHAMALFRLWWCPPGSDASHGVYVHYNLDHLLGILNLESQRNQCMVIAEDLGTVPDEVVRRFPQAQLYSNKVFYFEASPEGVTPPSEYAEKSLAIVANHDMPTLRAFWNKSDLELRRKLNMFPTPEAYEAEHVARDGVKQQILQALQAANMLPEALPADATQVPEMTASLSHAIHLYLASGSAQMVAVQLEDLMLINDPVNLPGTSDEYPNWRRKLSRTTAELFADDAVNEFARRMNNIRVG